MDDCTVTAVSESCMDMCVSFSLMKKGYRVMVGKSIYSTPSDTLLVQLLNMCTLGLNFFFFFWDEY